MLKETMQDARERMEKTAESLHADLRTIRTGRASPALVEKLPVEYYGAPTPLNQLAGISAPEPRLLMIRPWDRNTIGLIEKAILKSDLGITPVNDGKLIRLQIPDLSKERRIELAKVVKKMAEDGRISVRNVRHAAIEHLKKIEKDKIIAEDEKFTGQDVIQKLTDKYIAKVEELLAAKEKEITEI